ATAGPEIGALLRRRAFGLRERPKPCVLRAWLPRRQCHRAGTGMNGQRHRFRRWPEQRPVAGRQRDADPVSLRERPANVVELDTYFRAFARHHRFGILVAAPVAEIEHTVRDAM